MKKTSESKTYTAMNRGVSPLEFLAGEESVRIAPGESEVTLSDAIKAEVSKVGKLVSLYPMAA